MPVIPRKCNTYMHVRWIYPTWMVKITAQAWKLMLISDMCNGINPFSDEKQWFMHFPQGWNFKCSLYDKIVQIIVLQAQ